MLEARDIIIGPWKRENVILDIAIFENVIFDIGIWNCDIEILKLW